MLACGYLQKVAAQLVGFNQLSSLLLKVTTSEHHFTFEPGGDRRKTQVHTIGGVLKDVQLSDAKRALFHKGVLHGVSPKVQRLGNRVSDRAIAM